MPEFMITYHIEGTYMETIKAPDLATAEAMADAKIEDENWFPDLDEITNADHSTSQLYRVQRKDGTIGKTTYIRDTDTVLPDA